MGRKQGSMEGVEREVAGGEGRGALGATERRDRACMGFSERYEAVLSGI